MRENVRRKEWDNLSQKKQKHEPRKGTKKIGRTPPRKDCMEEYPLTKDEYEMIYVDYGEKYWAQTGIEYDPDTTLYRPVGCDACSNTGYRGRMGIHELMEGTPKIKLMIKKQASTEMLFAQAMKEGMSTLRQDGIMKVFKGYTDLSEVRRVCIN